MLQVLEEVLSEEDDKTHVSLVFANNTEQDIILKNRLDALAKKHPNRFEVHYVVAQPADAASWKGHTGFINADIVKKHIPGPAEDVMVYVCGPPPFYKALSGNKAPDYSQGEVRPVSPFSRTHTHTSPHAPHTPHAPTNAATLCVRSPAGRRAQGSGLYQGAGLQVLRLLCRDFWKLPLSPHKERYLNKLLCQLAKHVSILIKVSSPWSSCMLHVSHFSGFSDEPQRPNKMLAQHWSVARISPLAFSADALPAPTGSRHMLRPYSGMCRRCWRSWSFQGTTWSPLLATADRPPL